MASGGTFITSDMVGAGLAVVGLAGIISSVAPASIVGGNIPLDPAARGLLGIAATGAGAGILAVKDLLK